MLQHRCRIVLLASLGKYATKSAVVSRGKSVPDLLLFQAYLIRVSPEGSNQKPLETVALLGALLARSFRCIWLKYTMKS